MTDVYGIILAYLRRNGYDGLSDGEGCGCTVDDFAPCGSMSQECVPAKDMGKREGCDHYMEPATTPEGDTDV